MSNKILLVKGVNPEYAPNTDDRPETERTELPYFSHWEGECSACGHKVAADHEPQLLTELCEATEGAHKFESHGPIFYKVNDLDGWGGQIAL